VNCSGDSPIPLSTLGTSYVAATGGALVTALGNLLRQSRFFSCKLMLISLRHLLITVIFEDIRLQKSYFFTYKMKERLKIIGTLHVLLFSMRSFSLKILAAMIQFKIYLSI
jgi:hypothetical protein